MTVKCSEYSRLLPCPLIREHTHPGTICCIVSHFVKLRTASERGSSFKLSVKLILTSEGVVSITIRSMEDKDEQYPTFWIVVTNGIFAALGILGNILVLRVLSQRHMRNTFNKLRCALAVFDTLHLITAFLNSILEDTSRDAYKIVFPYFLWPITNVAHTASTFMTMTIAIERFVAISDPCQYKKNRRYRTTKYVVFVTIPAILLNITKWFELEPDSSGTFYKLARGMTCTHMYKTKSYKIYNCVIYNLLIKELIPTAVLIYTYAKIYNKVKTNRIEQEKSKISSIIDERNECRRITRQVKMARTFAGVVITSLVCNVPDMLMKMLLLANIASKEACEKQLVRSEILIKVRDLFLILNSVANIVIYTCLDTKFRQEFRKVVGSCKPGENHTTSNTIPMTSKETEMPTCSSVLEDRKRRSQPTSINLSSTDPK